LKIKGEKYLAFYLVEGVQDVYRFQGVYINDKHIEIIVRQMLKKLSVLDPGDSGFLLGEQVDKNKFLKVNAQCVSTGLQPAVAEPLVLGITQASLSTESFISAASFQETTKVLTESSLIGKKDYLYGLEGKCHCRPLGQCGNGF
jgi:DNA-directed RNA polymerase subunit beta'